MKINKQKVLDFTGFFFLSSIATFISLIAIHEIFVFVCPLGALVFEIFNQEGFESVYSFPIAIFVMLLNSLLYASLLTSISNMTLFKKMRTPRAE